MRSRGAGFLSRYKVLDVVILARTTVTKTEVPDPLVVEDLISYKLNNIRKLARLITQYWDILQCIISFANFRKQKFQPISQVNFAGLREKSILTISKVRVLFATEI